MIHVGFWREHEDETEAAAMFVLSFALGRPRLPWVRDNLRTNWIHAEKIGRYLEKNRRLFASYYGNATCVLCGEIIGNKEFTDGTFVWPEGLIHYIRFHDVMVPDDRFVAHVLKQKD